MKKIFSLLLCLFFIFSITACKEKSTSKQPAFDSEIMTSDSDIGVIAENENYRLEYDSSTGGVILTEIKTGKIWSTCPQSTGEEELDELGMPIKKHSMVTSPIVIRYRADGGKVDNEVYSYDESLINGRIVGKKTENGICVEYYFDAIKIMIPVTYTLHDDYVSVTVEPDKIQESGSIATSVSIAPFWCSVKNNSENSYLFIPSGSGALADVNEVSPLGNRYSASVFGKDQALEHWYISSNTKDIRLPVYGVKSGDTATFAVIESGADSALIESVSGAITYGYSSAYSTFNLRGSTRHLSEVYANEMADTYVYGEEMINTPLSVRFYPLTGENANYSGMAATYRAYLEKESGLKQNDSQMKLNLNFIGGTLVTKSFLGIPYKTLYPATEINDVINILNELHEEDIDGFSVNLKGFGESGIDIGKVAGGFDINGNIGTVKDLKQLSYICKNYNSKLYMDFELCRFNDGADGFSKFSDSIYAVTDQRNVLYLPDKAVRDDVEYSLYYMLSPWKFTEAAEKLVSKTDKWNLDGISLSSLSSLSYSDYRNDESVKYYSKSDFGDSVSESIGIIKESGLSFMASDSNVYAAVNADLIVDAPTVSTGDYSFDYDIPFYQMVFKGYIPMTSESINLSPSYNEAVLAAVEGGCGLNYTLTANWDNLLINAEYPYFYSTVYENVKENIVSSYKKLNDYYDKISGARISSHQIIESGIRKTVFDNGITVYLNYNDSAKDTPAGQLDAFDFKVLEGAE